MLFQFNIEPWVIAEAEQMIQENSKKTMEMTSLDGKFEDRGQRSVSVTSAGLR